ncbi:multiprotein-bridging factor 1c [Mercurialis annua]|uniref:multiprotein-bridging factor 1c n=1 Tax=Mercurialis annua TaxID=3986 RepID=UPI002160B458|nr:multiprotein-bridging factor 1c [Mercurialis annua]
MPSRSTGVITQDWNPVVLHKSKPKATDLRDPKAVNQALRSGAPVQTIKKSDGGLNKKSASAPVVNVRKLDEVSEPAAFDRVSTEVRLAIQKARLGKKMSQAELAKLINEQPKVVQEYENGKAVPNQAVLGKMEKVLGVRLRGKIGSK